MRGLIVDLFAGGGGASLGMEEALRKEDRPVDIAINHCPVALAVHAANHPRTRHLTADIWEVAPKEATGGLPVDILWASPDCTHFSQAKGGKPRKQSIRSLAWVVVRWASEVKPNLIFLENVSEFKSWGPLDNEGRPQKKEMGDTFKRWKRTLERLGYVVDYRVLVASHYGAPTSRKRLFLVARRDGLPIRWPAPTHGPGLLPFKTAASCIDWSIPCKSIFERKKELRPATLKRIAEGIRRFVVEHPKPFLVRYNDFERREQAISEPLTTIDTSNRFGLVAPVLIQTSYGERQGQKPRVLDIHAPLGTIMSQGTKHSLVTAFLAKHYKGVVGVPFDGRPLDTITTWDHHSLVVSFLTVYHGDEEAGQAVTDPLRTITTRDRMGLVTVQGVDYKIVDIGMRMLQPSELLAAQFGRFAPHYDLSAARTKTNKVRLIGNSVCPEVAEAVVAANMRREELRGAA